MRSRRAAAFAVAAAAVVALSCLATPIHAAFSFPVNATHTAGTTASFVRGFGILASTAPNKNQLTFQVNADAPTGFGAWNAIQFFLGNTTDPLLFPCAVTNGPVTGTPTSFVFVCNITVGGYGPWYTPNANAPYAPWRELYYLSGRDGGSAVFSGSGSDGLVFPTPTQIGNTLRTNVTQEIPTDGLPGIEFGVGLSNRTLVFLNGANFYPRADVMSVKYGYAANLNNAINSAALYWPCEYSNQTTDSIMACVTADPAFGRSLDFVVSVAGHVAPMPQSTTPNRINYSAKPVIANVSGCEPKYCDPADTNCVNGNPAGTHNCPTEGGITLRIEGKNLFAPLSVFINGASECKHTECNPLESTCLYNSPAQCPGTNFGTCIQCTLPVGTGVAPSLSVSLTPDPPARQPTPAYTDQASGSAYLSYARPQITRIESNTLTNPNGTVPGCHQTLTADTPPRFVNASISDCLRTGGDIVTLHGMNFGKSNAKILVGGSLGVDVTHGTGSAGSFTSPHRFLTFTVPAGSGTQRSVILLQSGGTLNQDSISLSYFQCPRGRFQTGTGGLTCAPCARGRYNPNLDAIVCQDCGTGTFAGADEGAQECKPCPAGRARSGSTPTYECDICAPGQEQPAQGQKSCNDCPPGKYSAANESHTCLDCEQNQFSQNSRSSTCSTCTGILFQNSKGQTACQSCLAGQYYNNRACSLCPTGAICDGARGIVTTDDYYVYYRRDTGPDEPVVLQSVQCLPQYCKACPATNATNKALTGLHAGMVFSCCSENRPASDINPMCGVCDTGYTIYGNVCVPCSTTDGGIVFLLIVMQWIYVTVFHWFAQIDNADLRIFLNFIQFVFLFLATQASNLTAWLSLFNFNILTSVSTTCVAPLTDMQSLASGIYVPMFGFALLGVNIGIHYIVWRFMRKGYCAWKLCVDQKYESRNPISNMIREQFVALRNTDSFYTVWNMYRRTALGFLANSYTSVSQSVFTFFSCIPVDGDRFIQSYPSISCDHDAEYLRLYPLFVVLTFILCAIPVLVGLRLWLLNRQGLLFGRKDIKVIYGSVIESYAPSKYAWECWVLIRRIVLCSIALDTFPDNLPQKFTYLCMCNILFLGVHYLARPYVLAMDNYAESLSLITLTLMTLFLISAPNPLPASYAIGLTVMAFLVAGAFVIRILLTRYEYMYRLKKEADRKRKEKELNLDQTPKEKDLANDEDFYAAEAEAEAEADAAAAGEGRPAGAAGGDTKVDGGVALDVKEGDGAGAGAGAGGVRPGDVEMVTVVDINQANGAGAGAGAAAAAAAPAAAGGELKNDDDFYAAEAAGGDAGAAGAAAAPAAAAGVTVDPSSVVVDVPAVSPVTPPPQYTPHAAAAGAHDASAPLAPADASQPAASSDATPSHTAE